MQTMNLAKAMSMNRKPHPFIMVEKKVSVLPHRTYLVAPNKFDIIRTVITATIVGAFAIILGSHSAPAATLVATSQGLEVAEGTGVTSMLVALSPEINLATFFGNNFGTLGVAGFAAILVAGIVVTGYFRMRYLKKQKA